MRVTWTIGLIAVVSCDAFFGLYALAVGDQQTTMEPGLFIPAQSDRAGPQSAPVVVATEEPTPTPESAPEDPASTPTPAPVVTNPHYVAPASPQRTVPDGDDGDNSNDHDDDTND